MMSLPAKIPWRYLTSLLLANLALCLPPAQPIRVVAAIALIGFLPGLSWANRYLPDTSPLLRWTIAAAMSYTFTFLTTLLLHYLPGAMASWQLLLILNLLAILPFIITSLKNRVGMRSEARPRAACVAARGRAGSSFSSAVVSPLLPFLFIFLLAVLLRTTNLGYSEFQGDEALVMISAAEALEGHADALLLRSKGPGEVLLPMAMWRLTGVINEPIARLPFTLSILWGIVTIYLIGHTLQNASLGWLSATFFTLNGFTVAFGRIVQYQALVLWLSSLAFLLALYWQQTRQHRFAFLSGLCFGAGLLAHYDTILVLPALGWMFIAGFSNKQRSSLREWLARIHHEVFTSQRYVTNNKNLLTALRDTMTSDPTFKGSLLPGFIFLTAASLVALPFYVPYSLDPQANRTGSYLGGRIGTELRNNLPDFFHFNAFYSSFYYILLTTLLVLGLLLWLIGQTQWGRGWRLILLGSAVLGVTIYPALLTTANLNLSVLPFALLLLGAFLALFNKKDDSLQALIVWLAVPFLGYNFVVALGLTHIYTIVPAWSLLAALAWGKLSRAAFPFRHAKRLSPPREVSSPPLSHFPLLILTLLSTLFLWNAFIRHDVEYGQDYPAGNLALFWTPYETPPVAGSFGFVHRAGWKAVGQKIAAGELVGDYGSNEEPDVTTWYTRGTPRACDPQPEYYFLADDLIDPVAVPHDILEAHYQQVGQVILPNHKQMSLMQHQPTTLRLGDLGEAPLARQFDQSATPAAFARSARGAIERQANFANLVQLLGYDRDTRRAYRGGRLPVTLYWRALAPLPANYQVFTHLENETAGLVAQADGVPVCWSYPTNLWRPGQIIADHHAISIPPEVPLGAYPLQIGFYLAETFERLDILDEAGNPVGMSLTLEVVEIGE